MSQGSQFYNLLSLFLSICVNESLKSILDEILRLPQRMYKMVTMINYNDLRRLPQCIGQRVLVVGHNHSHKLRHDFFCSSITVETTNDQAKSCGSKKRGLPSRLDEYSLSPNVSTELELNECLDKYRKRRTRNSFNLTWRWSCIQTNRQ